jgi:outer membrane protein assembly complex protein YaeT
MRRLLCVLCGLCILCAGARRASAAVGDYIGKPVASVRIVVEGRDAADPMLTSIVETVVGQKLSMAQVRETVAHLFSLGRFEGVSVDATLDDGRVALRYDLVPIHPVSRIRFNGRVGAPGIHTDALRRAIVDRYGTSPPLGRLGDMTRILADVLRERGYLHASIAPRAEIEHAAERATIVFTIEPGARTTIGGIEIIGRPTVSRAEFLNRLGVSPGAPYQRDALNVRIEKYLEERRKNGFYEATVVPAVRFGADERTADLTLTVAPGPRVRVVFTGDPLPGDRRTELVPVEREGSVDEDLLEDSSNRIEEYLKAQGYRDATAPHTRAEVNGELVITFNVTRGQPYKVSTFEISGNASVPLSDFVPALRLRDGQPFSEALMEVDRQMIEELYRRRGFATARARAAGEVITATAPPAQVPVRVRLIIAEGPRTAVDAVTLTGNRDVADAALRPRLGLQAGAPYVPGLVAVDRDAIQVAYQDAGYENTTVEPRTEFRENDTRVVVTFVIHEGPQVFVDHVLIVGNVRTRASTIERELQLQPGDPFSLAKINESQRRLASLGLFRRARITELAHGDETRRDLLVTVEESPSTTVGYGGGGEILRRVVRSDQVSGTAVERTQFAPRVFAELGRRNLFGKNRSLNLFTSVSQPTIGSDTSSDSTEYRVIGTFREPRVFDSATDALLNITFQRQIRSSFTYRLASASAEIVRRLTKAVGISGVYQLQQTKLVNESVNATDQPVIDRLFATVRLSSFTTSILRDTRDDSVNPQAGHYLSASGQLAGRAIGSEVGFAKSVLTAQTFHVLPQSHGVIFAGNVRVGLATGFPRDVSIVTETGQISVERNVKNLPEPERFFAGGDSTARGFALDTLGRPDTIIQGFPTGGNGLVLFNAELRAPVGNSQVVGFLDTGNVFLNASDIDLGELRSSAGVGFRARFKSFPLIRFDVGFKIHPNPGEDRSAWFISFGQAF